MDFPFKWQLDIRRIGIAMVQFAIVGISFWKAFGP